MSISSTLLCKDRYDGTKWDWSALPVCLTSGALVWMDLYVNTASGIHQLGDMKGKRIGVSDYQITAAVWMRKVMKDLYSIEPKDNIWYNARVKAMSRDAAMGMDTAPPGGVTLHWPTEYEAQDVMLDRGDLDAAFAVRPLTPDEDYLSDSGDTAIFARHGGIPLEGNPRIRKLFPDGGRSVYVEYYKKTGARQPNHHVIVQNRILKEHPWVALELMKAFQRSKEIAYERARKQRRAYFLFEGKDYQKQSADLGEDPFPVGLGANRTTLETIFQASLEQGLISKPIKLEEVYHPTTWET